MSIQITRTQIAEVTPFNNSTNGFVSTDVQAAIEEARTSAIQKVRYTIVTTFNGVVGNNQWLGFNELLPGNQVPIRIPINSILREIAFSFVGTSVDGNFQIYKNGFLAANIAYTYSFSNVDGGAIASGINLSFNSSEFFAGRWVDTGDNPSDMSVVYFFEVQS